MSRKSRYPRMNVAKLFDPDKIKPSIVELTDAVVDKMVAKDRAFWVDKPGVNDYTIHDANYSYGMATERVKPPSQDVFPRSYQYELDCVEYRRNKPRGPQGTSSQPDKRWRYYPDVTAKRSVEEIRKLMNEYISVFSYTRDAAAATKGNRNSFLTDFQKRRRFSIRQVVPLSTS